MKLIFSFLIVFYHVLLTCDILCVDGLQEGDIESAGCAHGRCGCCPESTLSVFPVQLTPDEYMRYIVQNSNANTHENNGEGNDCDDYADSNEDKNDINAKLDKLEKEIDVKMSLYEHLYSYLPSYSFTYNAVKSARNNNDNDNMDLKCEKKRREGEEGRQEKEKGKGEEKSKREKDILSPAELYNTIHKSKKDSHAHQEKLNLNEKRTDDDSRSKGGANEIQRTTSTTLQVCLELSNIY